MKRALVLATMSLLLLAAASAAREPYVQGIEEEAASLQEVRVDITSAEQEDDLAQGYDEYGNLGKRIYIEATAFNRAPRDLEFNIVFTARDTLEHSLATCEKRLRLRPGDERRLRCVLQVKDARELSKVTYSVLPTFSSEFDSDFPSEFDSDFPSEFDSDFPPEFDSGFPSEFDSDFPPDPSSDFPQGFPEH